MPCFYQFFIKNDQDLDPDKSPNAAIYKTSLGNMHTHKKMTKNNTSEHNDIKNHAQHLNLK